ncbi:cyanoexosortase C [Leptolyngbya sp. FACHB-17]|uniref:cyanoexosortase C n=1 Tax=unclassified Leptolyngbya TaxID=2650499 RepID=UPI001681BCD0|nr:cyanoexosortase C [Leptolyngbya sp. FACHB-17]MBD2081296.1 cyanoexosortase C [Leptolyngbya sp. FACHB-17]
MNWQKASAINSVKLKAIAHHLWRASIKTLHTRLVAGGLLVGAAYFPVWLFNLIVRSFHGSASVLMAIMIGLGSYRLWQQRKQITVLAASEDDRLLGHIIIGCGIVLSPLGFFSEWAQRLIFILILIGIALSSWGLPFFRRYPLPIALLGLGLFPQPTAVAKNLWQVFTPPRMLENFMAWSGTGGLNAIGHAAVQNETWITLAGKTVDVNWGCSGFDMATILAVASFVLGLFLKQSPIKITLMMAIGIVLAFIANVPRIMLLAMSEAYWGRSAFEFWHGPWGGQIFSTILFTIYYYVVMAIAKRKPAK